ncbi:MAG: diadenosine tetraphosphate (Ap4A) HIT family hydrolase [Halioglobus sp.]|jgi:diadenosine tetraphosphate (Ap4A) HIT family hydrolase
MDIWVKDPKKNKNSLVRTFFKNVARYLFSVYHLCNFHDLFMPKDEICPFCSKEVLKKQLVLEGRRISALYCLTPATTGNILVIPKRHLTRFEDLNAEEAKEIQAIITQLAMAFKEVYKVDDYVIIQKNGKRAGQSIAHIHFHVLPCPVDAHRIVDTAFKYRNPISDQEMKQRTAELQEYFEIEKKKLEVQQIFKKPRSRLARALRFPALRRLARRSRRTKKT